MELTCPAWVQTLVEGASGEGYTVTTRRIENATSLSEPALTAAVRDIYRGLLGDLLEQQRHLLRVWNFIPDIQAPMRNGDRYMAFNAGRYLAFAEHFADERRFAAGVPTASGVGVGGTALTVHALAGDAPGLPIENPRQIASYRYSARYGPRPPCFARAVHIGSLLLIGGTASIAGEDSQHPGDPVAQTRETLSNLGALVTAASGGGTAMPPLQALRDVRVHVARAADASMVRASLLPTLNHDTAIEFVQAALCRRELLVEIEAVASMAAVLRPRLSA
jgi:enamine deaminase RidA (YjgF/YER057c/UK114 family)